MRTAPRRSFAVALAVTLSTATFTLAQGPGGGGPGGGRGGRGGWGGRGQSILQLVQNPAVQKEIELSDAQKAKIETINQASRAKRQTIMAAAGFGNRGGNNGGPGGPGGNNGPNGSNNNNNGGGRRGNQANADVAANNGGGNNGGLGGNNGGGGGRGNRGGNANGGPGGFGPGGPGGFGPGGPGGFGPGGPGGFGPGGPGGPGGFNNNLTEEQQAARAEAFAAMRQLDQTTETAVLKVLEPKQRTRVSQIKLQSQGLDAFRTPELIAALKIPDFRAEEIAQILDGQGQARREQFGQMRELFAQFAGNNNNNGDNGNGNGGPGGGRPNRQQMQELMNNPDFQAKRDALMQKINASNDTLEEKTKAAVGRLLTKKQRDQYDKMLGEPFDVEQLRNGRGPGGPGGPGGNNVANNAATAPSGNAAPAARTASATAPAPAPTTSGAQPARKSLRDRRGGSSN